MRVGVEFTFCPFDGPTLHREDTAGAPTMSCTECETIFEHRREHTVGFDCWCEPVPAQRCGLCLGHAPLMNVCIRCEGTGLVAPYDDAAPVVFRHRG